jgi:hypothetical protein
VKRLKEAAIWAGEIFIMSIVGMIMAMIMITAAHWLVRVLPQ